MNTRTKLAVILGVVFLFASVGYSAAANVFKLPVYFQNGFTVVGGTATWTESDVTFGGGDLTSSHTTQTANIISATSAATATSAIAAITLAPSATLAANDLVFEVNSAAGTSLLSVDLEGDALLAGALAATGAISGASVSSAASTLLYADAGTVWAHTALKVGATGTPVGTSYAASYTIDFAGVTDVCEDSAAQTLTGAAVNDVCVVGAPASGPHANSWFTCYVSAADAIKIRHCGHGATGNIASGTYNARTFGL